LRAVSFKNIGLGKTDLAVFNALSGAVLRQEVVTFDYRKPGELRESSRRIRPYHLANRENSWYLVGFDLGREALRTFALPRIAGVAVTQEKFTRPADFSPEKFFASALGVLGGVGDYRVVIRFAPSVAERVREREWHESQEMRELPGGMLETAAAAGRAHGSRTMGLGLGRGRRSGRASGAAGRNCGPPRPRWPRSIKIRSKPPCPRESSGLDRS
jgi:predicted DNA-binding transcriptional regulator YafY